jgi:toxin CcdB
MARFDVYPNPGNHKDVPFLLDVQCGMLQGLNSRVVVPLRRVEGFTNVNLPKNLVPVFDVEGIRCFMETPALAAVPAKILKTPISSLADRQPEITAALDFLFQGF